MGLSFFMILLLKKQALTFVILLGYIAYSVSFLQDKYHLFDYMAYNLPLFESTITGFDDFGTILKLRFIYVLAGFSFICLTVFLFTRLQDHPKKRYLWLGVAMVLLVVASGLGAGQVCKVNGQEKGRQAMILNNDVYGHYPALTVSSYALEIEQAADGLQVNAQLQGTPRRDSSSFVFCLNPGLEVSSVTINEVTLPFVRDSQLLIVDFGKHLTMADTVVLSIHYRGGLDESFCYLEVLYPIYRRS